MPSSRRNGYIEFSKKNRSVRFRVLTLFLGGTFFLAAGTFYHKTMEEKELAARFGKDYEAYKKSTPFLIPRFKTKADQDSSRPTT